MTETILKFSDDFPSPIVGFGKRIGGGFFVLEEEEDKPDPEAEEVEYLFQNERIEFKLDVDIPGGAGIVDDGPSWSFDHLKISECHALGARGSGVKVGILDSGFDGSHPAFATLMADGKLSSFAAFDKKGNKIKQLDASGSVIPDDQAAPTHDHYHGTFVAGILAAEAPGIENKGLAPECELCVAQVLNEFNAGYPAQILAGMLWMADQQCDIVNISLGWDGYRPHWFEGISRLIQSGALVLVATGNEYGIPAEDPHRSPANYLMQSDMFLSIGSYLLNGADREVWENTGQGLSDWSGFTHATLRNPFLGRPTKNVPDLLAPGFQIVSTGVDGRFRQETGTSFATPMVSGIAALILGAMRRAGGVVEPKDIVPHLWECFDVGNPIVGESGVSAPPLDGDKVIAKLEQLLS